MFDSLLAFGGTDIGQAESGGFGPCASPPPQPWMALLTARGLVSDPPKVFGPFLVPNQIRDNTIILLPGSTWHSCDWANDTFGNSLYGDEAKVTGSGCCSNCNVSCCQNNCTQTCRAASFTLAEWQGRNPIENDFNTTLNRTTPAAGWITAHARALLYGQR